MGRKCGGVFLSITTANQMGLLIGPSCCAHTYSLLFLSAKMENFVVCCWEFCCSLCFFLGCMERTHHMTPYLQKETTTRLNYLSLSLSLHRPSTHHHWGLSEYIICCPFHMSLHLVPFLHQPHLGDRVLGFGLRTRGNVDLWWVKRAIVGDLSGLWIVLW